MEGNNFNSNAPLNLVLLGKTGAGKSSSGNTILGRRAFGSKKSSDSVTPDIAVESGIAVKFPVTVYDTPGFCDTKLTEEEIVQKHEKVLHECESGPCVFLLVISTDRFTEETQKTVQKIEKILGPNRLEKTWILFTRGDDLEEENMTIQEFIEDNEQLKTLVQKYEQRYHVFNNRMKSDTKQVRILLANILQETGWKLQRKSPVIKDTAPNEPNTPVSRRIVLLGKTGVGKSAVGNTILGQREFRSEISTRSVTRVCSEAQAATVSGRSVSVVDTPGFFDTDMKPDELMTEMARSVYLSSSGAHAFLIVFPVNMRYTAEEQQIPRIIEMMFGQEVLKYSIILFTHGDLLKGKTVETLIEENGSLRHLVQQCGGRYQVFNNEDRRNRDQVNHLLQKIDSMVEQNGGGHYSNKMFEDALRFKQEEIERRLRKEEERCREEEERWREEEEMSWREEEKQRQYELDKVRKETEERVRAEYQGQKRLDSKQMQQQILEETKGKVGEVKLKVKNLTEKVKTGFLKFVSTYGPYFSIAFFAISGAVIGGAIGAVAGTIVGGGLGFVCGAAAGAVGGAAGGAIVGSIIAERCKNRAGAAHT